MTHRAPIVIEQPSSSWATEFETEKRLLLTSLPGSGFHIEHIGSTAVPGLPAKPIIDMMLGAYSLSEIESVASHICSLGYQYMPEHEEQLPERRFFAKPVIRPRRIHLHGVVTSGRFWAEHLRFRDRLRECPSLAREYAGLKIRLAAAFGDDRGGYTEAKAAFIRQAISEAAQ